MGGEHIGDVGSVAGLLAVPVGETYNLHDWHAGETVDTRKRLVRRSECCLIHLSRGTTRVGEAE